LFDRRTFDPEEVVPLRHHNIDELLCGLLA
jgi:hypothetical protein